MTVLLVIFMIIIFLTADFTVQKIRLAKEISVQGSLIRIPAGIALASNHTWLRREPRENVTLGLDEFLGHMIGAVERILLPEVGTALTPATAVIMLRDGSKVLTLAAPVKGKVVAVNRQVLANPGLARTDPYGAGWLLKIQPERSLAGKNLLSGNKGIAWLRGQFGLAKEFFAARMPLVEFATMQDGGIPVEGMLKNCNEKTWEEFQKEFTHLQSIT